MTEFHLRTAVRTLRAGGVIAYPTEAVWGLGCDPLQAPAVARVLDFKQRPLAKGLIVIAPQFDLLRPFLLPLSKIAKQRVFATWPGPVTWLLPAAHWVPNWLTGGREMLAVRVTAHPLVRSLCGAFGGALVSTSANPAGRPPARTSLEVRRYFGFKLGAILPGATGGRARPTEIRDAHTGRVLRD